MLRSIADGIAGAQSGVAKTPAHAKCRIRDYPNISQFAIMPVNSVHNACCTATGVTHVLKFWGFSSAA
jgi:hypothetical protein